MLVSPTINSLHGRLISITGTDPPADTEISETVPARRRWIIRTLRFRLITDATPANRYITILIDDGTNFLLTFNISQVQSSGKTYTYSFANINVGETFVDGELFHPFPHLILSASCRLRTFTSGLQAGDNYSAPQLLVEEWIDP
ncbi:hypothetical protein ES708_25855 [subsurface metagenome]